MSRSWLKYFDRPEQGLSPAELDSLARGLGFPLPGSIRELYGLLSAGKFHFGLFIDEAGTYYDLHQLIRAYDRVKDGRVISSGLVNNYADIVKKRRLVSARLLPFAIESGGNYYCMDKKNESIWYADMELGRDGKLPPAKRLTDSLDEFLKALQEGE